LTHQEVIRISPLSNALSDHHAQCLIPEKFFQSENKNYNNQRNKFKCRLINSETLNNFQECNWSNVWSKVWYLGGTLLELALNGGCYGVV
jgi:hypothetical protein